MPLYPISPLDFPQVLKHVFDEPTQSLRTTATVSIPGATEVIISHVNDSIRLGDGTNLVSTTTVGADIGLDVNIIGGVVSGTFTPTGLTTGLKASRFTVTDSPAAVPAVAFANRNGLTIKVLGANTVCFGGATVTFATGYPKGTGEEIQMDVKDNAAVNVYAVCDTGKSSEIAILEVA